MSEPNQNQKKQPPDEIKIAVLRPVTPGIGMFGPGALDKAITARTGKGPGCDITWVRWRRAYRIEHFGSDGKLMCTKWVSDARVEECEDA